MLPIARPLGLLASLAIHAGLTAGLAFGGTSRAPASVEATTRIEIETVAVEPEPTPTPPAPLAEPSREPAVAARTALARHAAVVAAPALAVAAPAPRAADDALPRFTMTIAAAPGSTNLAGPERATVGPERALGGETPVLPASAAQVRAQLVAAFPAAYPFAARSDGVEGEVPLELVLDEAGRVIEARVVRAAGNGFDASALSAVRRYRFAPAERDGHPIRVRMPWTVQFRLH